MIKIIFFFILLIPIYGRSFGKERIVSTSPSLTEMVKFLGVENRLVAVSDFCQGVEVKERVGSSLSLNLEKVALLKPSLVLLDRAASTKVRNQLEKLKISYVVYSHESLEDLLTSYENFSERFSLQFSRKVIDSWWQLPSPSQEKTGLIIIGSQQGIGGIKSAFLATKQHYLSQLVRRTGVKNIYSGHRSQVTLESLFQLRPQYLLLFQSKLTSAEEENWRRIYPKAKIILFSESQIMIPQLTIEKWKKKLRARLNG